MGLESVRARLRDRQVKDGARGTVEANICLDVDLLNQLGEIQADIELQQRVDTAEPTGGRKRFVGTTTSAEPSSELLALNERLAEKENEVRAASLRLVFRSVSSSRYQEIVNRHPEADETSTANAEFRNDLAQTCLAEVWEWDEGEQRKVDGLAWAEIAEAATYGEWETTTLSVITLNRRRVDIPFSLRSSDKTRR